MIRYILTTAILICLAGFARGSDTQQQESLQVILDLSDGSRIVGAPNVETIRVVTEYADMELSLKKVVDVIIADDHENANVKMQNGDTLKGIINLGPLALKTLFGEVAIGVQHITQMHVERIAAEGPVPYGLVLWNQLGSDVQICRSVVGPGGQKNAGRFVEGYSGKGVQLTMDEQYGVTFPPDVLKGPAGCVEIWARLIDFPQALPWGNRPGLIAACDAKDGAHFILHFNGNDGNANGGICARVPGLGNSGTARFGSWTFAKALGSDTVDEWHHYAIVWDSDGIEGVDNGTRKMAVFLDGQLNSTAWNGPMGDTLNMPMDGRFGLLAH